MSIQETNVTNYLKTKEKSIDATKLDSPKSWEFGRIFSAIASCNLHKGLEGIVKNLLDIYSHEGVPLSVPHEKFGSVTLLHVAVEYQNIKLINLLFKLKVADANANNYAQYGGPREVTPFIIAVEKGSTEVIKKLVQEGARLPELPTEVPADIKDTEFYANLKSVDILLKFKKSKDKHKYALEITDSMCKDKLMGLIDLWRKDCFIIDEVMKKDKTSQASLNKYFKMCLNYEPDRRKGLIEAANVIMLIEDLEVRNQMIIQFLEVVAETTQKSLESRGKKGCYIGQLPFSLKRIVPESAFERPHISKLLGKYSENAIDSGWEAVCLRPKNMTGIHF